MASGAGCNCLSRRLLRHEGARTIADLCGWGGRGAPLWAGCVGGGEDSSSLGRGRRRGRGVGRAIASGLGRDVRRSTLTPGLDPGFRRPRRKSVRGLPLETPAASTSAVPTYQPANRSLNPSPGRPLRNPGDGCPEDPHPNPLPERDLCVLRAWLRGRPLTDFGRRRPNLPLPSARVKSGGRGGRCSTLAWLLQRSSHPRPRPLPQGDLCVTRSGCPEDPHPDPLPEGEGLRGAAGEVGAGFCNGLSWGIGLG